MPAERVTIGLLRGALRPEWPAPASVNALMSTREGGVSRPPFDSLNLRPAALPGDVVDDPLAVAENQRRFAAALGATPVWLDQVHGAAASIAPMPASRPSAASAAWCWSPTACRSCCAAAMGSSLVLRTPAGAGWVPA
jgi:copper oxidase (laccase) domain-containing protein